MPPQSHTVQVTVLGLNGITLTGTNTKEAAVETSATVSFSRKKSIYASVPSCNLINVGDDCDKSDTRGKVNHSRYMTVWKYDDDTMTDGCLITFQTKLHKKKGTAGFETRSFDVNVGLIQGSENISLGMSLLNITGPVHGMQFDLPIRSVDTASRKNEKNIFGRNGNNVTTSERIGQSSDARKSIQFTSDPKTTFGLDSDASLRIHVAIMLTKHFDEKEKAKALHRSLLLNQMNMVAANYHSQPIVIDAMSTDSPLSSISHTIYTNDMSSHPEDRSNSTKRSNKSKQHTNQGISSNRLKQVPPLSENRLLVNQGTESKSNSSHHSKRPPLPIVNSSLKHVNDEKVTVSTHASTSTNQESMSEDESNSNNKKKSFSLKKAISRFSPKHVNCAGPQAVALQRHDMIITADLENKSTTTSKTTQSLQPHDRSVTSDLENKSSSTSKTNHDHRQKSPASYHSLRNVSHNSNPPHDIYNKEFINKAPSGRSRDYSQDSRRSMPSSENAESRNPPITHNLGGVRPDQEMRQPSRRQSLQKLPDHDVNSNRHQHIDIRDTPMGLTEQQYIDTNIMLQRQLTSMKIERQNKIDMQTNPVTSNDGMSNRSPARDGCVSVVSGPSMPGILEENHPYQFNQISKRPNRGHKKVLSDTSENGLYDMLKSGLMCQTTQPGQCLGSKNPKDAISPSPKVGGPPMVINVNPEEASIGDLTSITFEKEQQTFLSSRMIPAAFGGDGMCTAQNVRNNNYSHRQGPRTIDEEYRNLGEGGLFHNQYVPEMKRTIGKPPGGIAGPYCGPTGFLEEKYRRRRPPTPHYTKQGELKNRNIHSRRQYEPNDDGYDSASSYSDHEDEYARRYKYRNR